MTNIDILRDIEEKKKLIEKDSLSYKLSKKIISSFDEEALYHSNLLEITRKTRAEIRNLKKDFSNTRENLVTAWNYAVKNFEDFNSNYVCKIASLLEGDKNFENYRQNSVRVSGNDAVFPPRAEKVSGLMEKLITFAKDSKLHPVETSGILHMHFLRIHPFDDGNGRTSRILQNVFLNKKGYAPAIIPSGEREIYQGLLRGALRDYRDRESMEDKSFEKLLTDPIYLASREINFLDYLGSKVNVSMDNIFDEINKLPKYTILLSKLDSPAETISVKHAVDAYFRKKNSLGQVRVKSKKGGILEVRGEIGETNLRKIVNENYSRKCKVSSMIK